MPEDEQALVAAGGWCAPSETIYALDNVPSVEAMFGPSRCPAQHPESPGTWRGSCSLPDRLDRHGQGHLSNVGERWPITCVEEARWNHACPKPEAQLAWDTLIALGAEPEEVSIPCGCGATWSLGRDYCYECGRVEGGPQWSRWPPEGGAWDGTFSVARGGIRFGGSDG